MIFPDIKRNDIWQKGHNVLSTIQIDEKMIHLKNIRDMDHLEQKEKYFDKSYYFDSIVKLNLISIPFGFKKMMSHVMLEYVFKDDTSLVLSIEARRRPGESFSITKGLFFGYGLIYVWGTANDLIGLRRDIRKDKVFSFKLNVTKEEIEKSLIFFANRTNILFEKPKYYNSIFSNCTTNLWDVFNLKISGKPKRNYQIILNGNIDRYLVKLGFIKNDN